MFIQSYSDLARQFQNRRYQYLTDHMSDRYGWSAIQADASVRRYLMFLYIKSVHQSLYLVPTEEIDCVWEADILHNTAQYMQTCEQLCGSVIHHAATEEIMHLPDFPGMEAAFVQTRELFNRYFGERALGDRILKAAACGVL